MKEKDIFIAYHGTYDQSGSVDKARELYYFLQSSGIDCYFFPNEQNSYFANTPIIAQKAKKFIFVCNPTVELLADGSIKSNGVLQEITSFWNCIYEGKRQRGDARVYTYDGFSQKDANNLHIAFQGVAHFDEKNSSQDLCFGDVLQWIKSSEFTLTKGSNDELKNIIKHTYSEGISTELKKVFIRRSVMSKSWDLSSMILIAKKIECIGISNNELTLNMGEDILKKALDQGTEIELMFLDPVSKYVHFREKEEHQVKNTIKDNTKASLSFIKRVKSNGNLSSPYNNLKIYLYDFLPRMNMIFIDGSHLLLQYYANAAPGASNPCFYIKRQSDGDIFDFYYKQYQMIKSKGKEIK